MPEVTSCLNQEPHMFHPHEMKMGVYCSGETRCGEKTHEPHTFTEQQTVWCPGICNCGLRSYGKHGPGEHK